MNVASSKTGKGASLLIEPAREEASLWRRLKSGEDPACRVCLFEKYQSYARSVAYKIGRTRPSHAWDKSELEQIAYTGLLEAIDKYEPSTGVPFKGYARHRIRGSILDGLQSATEASAQYAHEREKERERLRSLNHARDKDSSALQKTTDIAVGLAIGFLLEAAGLATPEDAVDPSGSAYETTELKDVQNRLRKGVKTLTPPQDTIIAKHYFEGVPFLNLAKMLSLSKGRISQLHRLALETLRDSLKGIR